jgi:hypothetical protein
MIDETLLEKRLEGVEREVADLRRQLAERVAPAHWLDQVIGSITDESAFREAVEYGKAYRSADRPADEADGSS